MVCGISIVSIKDQRIQKEIEEFCARLAFQSQKIKLSFYEKSVRKTWFTTTGLPWEVY